MKFAVQVVAFLSLSFLASHTYANGYTGGMVEQGSEESYEDDGSVQEQQPQQQQQSSGGKRGFRGSQTTANELSRNRKSGFGSFIAEQCPFAPSSNVAGVLDEVKAAIKARSEDAKCAPLQQSASALSDASVRNSTKTPSSSFDGSAANCSNYQEVHNFEIKVLVAAHARGQKQSFSDLTSGCDSGDPESEFRECV
ncbi:MAG: hypothetical protein V4692_07860, partial [Bdellovibrionota bacterium]